MTASSRWICAAGIACSTHLFAADFAPPQPLDPGRYDKMIEDWPFALASPTAPVVEEKPGFAVNLHVMGVSRERYPDGRERDVVAIKSQADQSTFLLFGNEPNKEGVSVASVDWSNVVGKTTVTIKKGSEFAPLIFDQALIHSAGQPPVTPGQPRLPGAPPQSGAPTTSLPPGLTPNNGALINGQRGQNRVQPVIPRPNGVPPNFNQPQPGAFPQALPGAQPGAVPGQAPASDPRRRIRVINSKP